MSLGSLGYSLGAGSKVRIQYLQNLVSSLGNALLLSEETPIRRIELQALANMFHDLGEHARSVRSEFLPGGASQTLDDWAKRLGVPITPQDSDALIRASAASKYKAQAGPTTQVILDTIETALGSSATEVLFADGYFAEQYTFWAGVNPGTDLDLGTDAVGQYSSIRSHILAVVAPLPGKSLAETQAIIETKLFSILDSLLPAYATWDYEISNEPYEEGFELDEDFLDVTAL